MSGSRASWPGRARLRVLPDGLRVVLYHHLTDRPTDLDEALDVATPPALFEAHIARLMRDYDVVDLDVVLSGRMPRRALLITFDDGYRSILDIALPVLARLGLPSVFFVTGTFLDPEALPLDNLLCWLAARVGLGPVARAIWGGDRCPRSVCELIDSTAHVGYRRRRALGDELSERYGVDRGRVRGDSGLFLEREELARLRDFGCEAANHTRTHPFCRTIVDERAGEEEVIEHQAWLQEWTGRPIRAFSYPYGSDRDATPRVERMLTASGHQASFLVQSRPNYARHLPGALNRVSLHDRPVSQLTRQLEILPPLRAVRDAMHKVT